MFPQTYGTQYYGKRLPITTTQQVTANTLCASLINMARIYFIHTITSVTTTAKLPPKTINHLITTACHTNIIVKRHISKMFTSVYGWLSGIEQDESYAVDESVSWDENEDAQVLFAIFWDVIAEHYIYGAISNVVAKTTKAINLLLPIDAISNTISTLKKQAQKGLPASVTTTTKLRSMNIHKRIVVSVKTIVPTIKKYIPTKKIAVYCVSGANSIKRIMKLPIVTTSIATSIKEKLNVYRQIIATAIAESSVYKYSVMDIEFMGSFKPGDVVKINSQTLEVTLNNTNVLHLIGKSRFPIIRPGEQEFAYEDSEGNRQVKVTIRWKDKWV